MFGSRTGSAKRRALARYVGDAGEPVRQGEVADVAPSDAVFALGELELAAGSDRLEAVLGDAALTITADEWALFPEERPAAVHRVTVRLDGHPLLPGRIRVAGAGQLPVEGQVPWIPGGGTLTVCAGIDERIVVTENKAWETRPGDQGRQRRREGGDAWLVNATSQAVTVAVYRTLPVSTAEEVVVEQDAATTPGAQMVLPGFLRWQLTLPPGTPICVSLGWTLKASGSFTFE